MVNGCAKTAQLSTDAMFLYHADSLRCSVPDENCPIAKCSNCAQKLPTIQRLDTVENSPSGDNISPSGDNISLDNQRWNTSRIEVDAQRALST
jgi:hypothetical protein